MKGYKGLEIHNGIIRGSHEYIFEIGVPSVESRRDENRTDFQDCYFHYCESIEDVLNWRNFLSVKKMGMVEYRLFEIEAEDHYFMNYDIDWVTNRMTIIREIDKMEIIKYFDTYPSKKEIAKKILKNNGYDQEKIFEAFVRTERALFHKVLNDQEVITKYIKNCFRYGQDYCPQKEAIALKINQCEECEYYSWLGSTETYISNCYYELVRNAISRGEEIEDNIYFKYLLEMKSRCELEAIERLRNHYK